MKKFLLIPLSIVAVVATAAFGGYKGVALAAGDLCGGTGGNGQIVRVGND